MSSSISVPRLLISAAHKSSGKTTVSVGLCVALRARGLAVQPFKKGPDYIDPMWLASASGRACRNLDFYVMERDEIAGYFSEHSAHADVALIEGNKGLYDGLDLDGSNSNAALAALLDAPVVLVLDARGMTRGIAPLILGYQAFDRNVRIAGVILNNLGGARHEAKLRAVIEHYTDVPVVGAVHCDPRLEIVERHLGLVPSNEAEQAAASLADIGKAIGAQVDLPRILQVAGHRPETGAAGGSGAAPLRIGGSAAKVRIGYARDRAFGFYYADDLEAMSAAGAELVPFDTLHDTRLPALDGMFIGGGFPEQFMAELEANAAMRRAVRAAIEGGMPAYAECGGLMYLARSLSWHGETRQMAGVIPADVVMHAKPVGRGYVRLRENRRHPWPTLPEKESAHEFGAHEFHYSSLENLDGGIEFAYEVKRGYGADGSHDGIVYKNLLASYCHRRSVKNDNWAARFVAFVKRIKTQAAAESDMPLRCATGSL